MTSATPDLCIVIVSWNTRDLLRDCLCSVTASLERTPELSAEIRVVDNASSDGSAAMVREHFPGAQVIENGQNLGFARAVNQALAQTSARYLLLLNPDTVVPHGAPAALVAVMDSHPDAAACGPLLLGGDSALQPSWARFPGPASEWTGSLDRSQSPYPLADLADPTRREPRDPFAVDWVGGACLLLRHAALKAVGPLDEGFFLYGEEVELCHRLRRILGENGGKTLLIPAVTVTHFGGRSSRAVPRAARRHLFLSSVRLYRRLYGVSPVAGAAILLAAARYALSPLRQRGRGADG